MVLTILQAQTLINWFKHLNINRPVRMADLNDVLITFEGNINPGDLMGTKLYLQATKEIDKDTYKLDISISNVKDIVDQFLVLANKYC